MNIVQFIKDLSHQPYIWVLLAMLTCFCFYYLKDEKNQQYQKVQLLYYAVFAVAAILFAGKIAERIYNPKVFDFTVFYLYGKVAVAGYNFYLPESFHTVFNSLHDLPQLDYGEFKEEILNTGFLYPPPTILLFSPMGFLSYHTAFLCWTAFILLFVPGCIYLGYDLFFKQYKLNGLLLVSTLFFLLPPVISTIGFSQTNFILLFLLLLMRKYKDKNFAGIFLALAFFTKPYMIVFAFFFLARKKWGALAYFIASALFITGFTFVLFGKESFITYILNNPAKRLPAWVFDENINQSLHAVLLRANLISLDKPFLYYAIIGIIVVLTGLYLVYLIKKKLYDITWLILLLVGLLLYPGTLSYYGTLLLFVVFQFFEEQQVLGFNRYIIITLLGIFYFLSAVSVFSCICFLLFIVVFKSLKYPSAGKLSA